MFQPWRIQLRQAEEAVRRGQWDEARRLLCAGGLREYRPGKALAVTVAEGLARRATERAAMGDTLAGWKDVALATDLAGESDATLAARRELTNRGLAEAERYLEAGDIAAALTRLDALRERRGDDERLRVLTQVARHLQTGHQHARRGNFERADGEFSQAAALRPDLPSLEKQRQACTLKLEQYAELRRKFQAATAAEKWSEVVSLADEMLRLATDDVAVRQMRERAWDRVVHGVRPLASPFAPPAQLEPPSPVDRTVTPGSVPPPKRRFTWSAMVAAFGGKGSAPPEAARLRVAAENAMPPISRPSAGGQRIVAWVDGVGGFLLCLGDEVVIGQPVADGAADVPIIGDLSRRHAVIRRDCENYVLVPLAKVSIAGREVNQELVLTDGMVLELGSGVKLRFRRPHPLSGTARLELVSRHRFQPHVDAVILLAATCVLGPQPASHIVCRDWPTEVVLFRDGNQLHCRAAGNFEIDHVTCHQRGVIGPNSHIAGEGFEVQLEELG